jgi:hypothetical protein
MIHLFDDCDERAATRSTVIAGLDGPLVEIPLTERIDGTFELRDLSAHHAWPDVDVRSIEMDEL